MVPTIKYLNATLYSRGGTRVNLYSRDGSLWLQVTDTLDLSGRSGIFVGIVPLYSSVESIDLPSSIDLRVWMSWHVW